MKNLFFVSAFLSSSICASEMSNRFALSAAIKQDTAYGYDVTLLSLMLGDIVRGGGSCGLTY